MSNDNNIFFLGAGFSKAICDKFPLLGELSKELIGENFERLPKYDNLKYLPNSCKNNFEALLTYLSTDLPWKDERTKKLDEVLYIDITRKLKDYFTNNVYYDMVTADNSFASLWKHIMQEGTPVITLNYDTIVEKMLLFNEKYNERKAFAMFDHLEYEKFYRGKIIDSKNITSDVTLLCDYMPEVLKLHGSENWYYLGDEKYSQIYCGEAQTESEILLMESLKPFIIPPVFDKTKFYKNQTLQYLWQKAFKYIVQASKIYIIGFSFPVTDLSVKYLFESAMNLNCYNPQIYVINTDTSDCFKNTYINIFGETRCNFDYCCENALKVFIENELQPSI